MLETYIRYRYHTAYTTRESLYSTGNKLCLLFNNKTILDYKEEETEINNTLLSGCDNTRDYKGCSDGLAGFTMMEPWPSSTSFSFMAAAAAAAMSERSRRPYIQYQPHFLQKVVPTTHTHHRILLGESDDT